MSMVVASVGPQFAIISGDTRALEKDTRKVVSEDFRKVYKLNDNVLIGFVGTGTPIKCLEENFGYQIDNKFFADEFAKEFFELMKTNYIEDEYAVLIVGKMKNGNGWCTGFNHLSKKMDIAKQFTENSDMFFLWPDNEEADYSDMQSSQLKKVTGIVRHAKNVKRAVEEISTSVTYLIQEVSKEVDSVNRNIVTYSLIF